MNRPGEIFNSLRSKVLLALIIPTVLSSILCVFFIWRYTCRYQFDQLRRQVIGLSQAGALCVDGAALTRIPLSREGVGTPEYKEILRGLRLMREANPVIKYIYTLRRVEQGGQLVFAVDPDCFLPEEDRRGRDSYPGDAFDAARAPAVMLGYMVPAVDKVISTDRRGTFISGYAPIKDREGETVGILGLDADAGNIVRMRHLLLAIAAGVFGAGVLFALIVGLTISTKLTTPLEKLTAGIQHVSLGNLNYRVSAEGTREISELAQSFNRMAASLESSNRMLHSYFYRVVQSLVRILEARDFYTKGHSERVAKYAEKIAVRMHLPQEKITLVKDVALLHDIGKLGIPEALLNKKEELTEDEKRAIRVHPALGEEILKPVFANKEMLTMIRRHHERHDGQGYPDKAAGDNLSLYTQIITVADSYDAMTSPRAYRAPLTKEKAIEELKAHRGTQFNPRIVDIFIKILQEEYNTFYF